MWFALPIQRVNQDSHIPDDGHDKKINTPLTSSTGRVRIVVSALLDSGKSAYPCWIHGGSYAENIKKVRFELNPSWISTNNRGIVYDDIWRATPDIGEIHIQLFNDRGNCDKNSSENGL